MIPALIPQPRRYAPRPGHFAIPATGWIGIADARLAAVAADARALLPGHHIATAGTADTLSFAFTPGLAEEGYRLVISSRGIVISAGTVSGAFHGLSTLRQLLAQREQDRLACCRIDDAPEFPLRGVYYDVTRGRVPHTQRLIEQANLLADYKINHLQHYVEHTFRFRAHPLIGRGASPLTPEDVLALDAACRARRIDLVPSLASFGHMATVLRHKPYHHLAEDRGVNSYEDPEAGQLAEQRQRRGWSLAPANPASYRFLESLYAEFLPLFSSELFNACCDETYDLGLGQSYRLARRIGKGRLYLNHVLQLRKLARRHGKRLMFWGDIIHHYPDLIPEVPRDVMVLDWGYDHRTNFDRVAAFRKAGLPFLACPGTSAWVSLFPRLHEGAASISGYTRAAMRHGASGILNTDWGDRGHFNFMEFSWHGYLFGAEQSWNPAADAATFTQRFARVFLRTESTAVVRAITALGDVTHLATDAYYQSIWYHVFFAPPGSPLFQGPRFSGFRSRQGRCAAGSFRLDARLGRETRERLEDVRRTLDNARRARGADPQGILPYWLFAVDTLIHAARRLEVLAPGGRDTMRSRRALRDEMSALMARFTRLWLARSRRSEIGITLRAYRNAMQGL